MQKTKYGFLLFLLCVCLCMQYLLLGGGVMFEKDTQKCYFGNTCHDLVGNTISPDDTMIAGIYNGSPGIIQIWDVKNGKRLIKLSEHKKHLTAISFSRDNRFVAAVGKDFGGRILIVIWEITTETSISSKKSQTQFKIIAKQISDFSIKTLKFIPYGDGYQLVSVGKNSIRFWRIKNGHLPGRMLQTK